MKRRSSAFDPMMKSQKAKLLTSLPTPSPLRRSAYTLPFNISRSKPAFVTPDQKLDGTEKKNKNLDERWNDCKQGNNLNNFQYPHGYHFNHSSFYYPMNPYYYMHPPYQIRHQEMTQKQSSIQFQSLTNEKAEEDQTPLNSSTSQEIPLSLSEKVKKFRNFDMEESAHELSPVASLSPTHSIIEAALNEQTTTETNILSDDDRQGDDYVSSPFDEASIMLEFETCWIDPIPINNTTEEPISDVSNKKVRSDNL